MMLIVRARKNDAALLETMCAVWSIPAMLKNPRHEQFAQAYAAGGNASEAWRLAGGKGRNGNVIGSRWLAKVDIARRVGEIRREMETRFSMSREDWLTRLQAVADGCREAGERVGERQALRELGLGLGWYAAERTEVAVKAASLPSAEHLLASRGAKAALARVLANSDEGRAAMAAVLSKSAA